MKKYESPTVEILRLKEDAIRTSEATDNFGFDCEWGDRQDVFLDNN